MYFVFIGLFVIGIIVLLSVLRKQRKEEDYYDRFYFIVSSHDSFSEYLSIKNRLSEIFAALQEIIYNATEKHLGHTEFHKLVHNAGFYRLNEIAVFYISAVSLYILKLIIVCYFVLMGDLETFMLPIFSVLYYFGLKIYLEKRYAKELRSYRSNFVYFLDLMATCIKTGMTMTASVDAISPMLYKFSRLLSNSINNFGRNVRYSSLEDSCDKLFKEIPLSEVREFTSTVKNSAQFGAGMHSSLQDLASEIRKFHFIETEEKIGSVNAKMGIPLILFIMFPIIVEIIAPGLLRVMETMSFGDLG